MKTMFNKAKVKSWIKKAYKRHAFSYGHGYITDGCALLVDEPHMHPTILEVFGTLTPDCRYSLEQFQRMMSFLDEPVEVIDSQLELVLEPKHRLRIFYNPRTGQELTIDSAYFDLLDDPKAHRFYSNELIDMLWITHDDEIVGVIAPFRLQNQLSHIRFNVEEVKNEKDH